MLQFLDVLFFILPIKESIFLILKTNSQKKGAPMGEQKGPNEGDNERGGRFRCQAHMGNRGRSKQTKKVTNERDYGMDGRFRCQADME